MCDRKTLMEIADEEICKIVHVIPAEKNGQKTAKQEATTDLSSLVAEEEWYGILEVELY